MCMAVYAGAICEPVFLCNGRGASPTNKGSLDFFPLGVGADGTIALVPSNADCMPLLTHAPIVPLPLYWNPSAWARTIPVIAIQLQWESVTMPPAYLLILLVGWVTRGFARPLP